MKIPSSSMENFAQLAPKLAEIPDSVLFGDLWNRPQLSPRENSIASVSTLTALYRLEQLPFHLQKAIENGVNVNELGELVTHIAFNAGWPAAVSAIYIIARFD